MSGEGCAGSCGRPQEAQPMTFYKRILPEGLVAFSSASGLDLFSTALREGNMKHYFRLSEQFLTQNEPAYCGLASMVMILNAMAVDPRRVWKGPWRWYHEDLLDCCVDLDKVKREGISRGALSCLALCNGLKPRIYCGSSSSEEELRDRLRDAFRDEDFRPILAQFSRSALGQTGDGHFSPVAGYCEEKDMALVMDVARFKYPPYWVPVPLLWKAINTVDNAGVPRCFMSLELISDQSEPLCRTMEPSDLSIVLNNPDLCSTCDKACCEDIPNSACCDRVREEIDVMLARRSGSSSSRVEGADAPKEKSIGST